MIKLEDLKTEMVGYIGEYGKCLVDYDNGYICDIVSEIADNQVDTYTDALIEWCKNNYSYVEDYVDQFGIDDKNFDFLKLIRGGQYLYIEDELYESLNDIILNWIFNYIKWNLKIEELTEEEAEEVRNLNDKFENDSTLEEIIEEIEEIFKNRDGAKC